MLVGIAGGLGAALYLYNTTYFFGFSGAQIATTGVFVSISPLVAYWLAPYVGHRFGKPRAAIAALSTRLVLYPTPYVLLLTGNRPPIASWTSLAIYSVFIVVEVIGAVIGNVLLDSMMADVVEDSEVVTQRRSEGLFFAARGCAYKTVSAGGIIGAGTIVSMVGLDGITSLEQVTNQIRFDLAVAFLPVYLGLCFTALAIVSRYGIDRAGHTRNLDTLSGRQPVEAAP